MIFADWEAVDYTDQEGPFSQNSTILQTNVSDDPVPHGRESTIEGVTSAPSSIRTRLPPQAIALQSQVVRPRSTEAGAHCNLINASSGGSSSHGPIGDYDRQDSLPLQTEKTLPLGDEVYEVHWDREGPVQGNRNVVVPIQEAPGSNLPWTQLPRIASIDYEGTTYTEHQDVMILVSSKSKKIVEEPGRINEIRELGDGRKQMLISWYWPISEVPNKEKHPYRKKLSGRTHVLTSWMDVIALDTLVKPLDGDASFRPAPDVVLDIRAAGNKRLRDHDDPSVAWLKRMKVDGQQTGHHGATS